MIGRPLAIAFLDMDGVMIDRLYNGRTQWAIGEKYTQLLQQPRYAGRSVFSQAKAEYMAMKRAEAACLSESALERLQSLAQRVEDLGLRLVFVISSSWREFLTKEELIQDVFADQPWIAERILDKTPDDDASYASLKYHGELPKDFKTPSDHCLEEYGFSLKHYRGRQIEYWLRENCAIRDIYSYVILDDLYSSAAEFDRHPGRFVSVNYEKLFSQMNEDAAFDILAVPIPREPLAGIALF